MRFSARKKNEKILSVSLPSDVIGFIVGKPEGFGKWVKEKVSAGKNVTIKPDIIFDGGAFIEVKSGDKGQFKPEKKYQLYRMLLYKLPTKERGGIRIIKLQGDSVPDPEFPQITHENVFDTPEYKKFITKHGSGKTLKNKLFYEKLEINRRGFV